MNTLKNFIAKLPDSVKPSLQRKLTEYRKTHPDNELPDAQIEELYSRARQLYHDKGKQVEASIFMVEEASF